MPNLTVSAAATGLPPRIPPRLSLEAEFLLLMDLRSSTDRRLGEIVDILDSGVQRLPLSGLRAAAPGVLLFKGGRHV